MRKSSAFVTFAIMVFVLQGILVSMASCVKVGQEKPSNLQEVVPAEAKEWLRAIYELGEFNAKSFRGDWLQDGSGYMVLEPVAGENERELVSYDVTSGNALCWPLCRNSFLRAPPILLQSEAIRFHRTVAGFSFRQA